MEIQNTAVNPEKFLQTDKTVTGNKNDRNLRKQCTEFESFLYNCMLKSMRKTVPEDGLFSGGNAENIYRSMLDQEYSQMMSKNVDSGLADALYNQLKQKQHEIDTLNP